MFGTFITLFIKIKKFSLISSKIVSLIVCFVCMFYYDRFQLSFNIPEFLQQFDIFITIKTFMDSIGLFFLTIPIVVIILSFYFPEQKFLAFLSALLSIFSNVFTLALGILKGTFKEFVNAKIFVVYNVISLETKRNIFISHLNKQMEDSVIKSAEYAVFVQEDINKNFNIMYVEKLKITPVSEIPLLVKNILINIANKFEKIKTPILNENSSLSFADNLTAIFSSPSVIKMIFFIGAVGVVYFISKKIFSSNEHHITQAELADNIVVETNKTTDMVNKLAKANNDTGITQQELINGLSKTKNQILELHAKIVANKNKTDENRDFLIEFKRVTNDNAATLKRLDEQIGTFNIQAIMQDIQNQSSRLANLESKLADILNFNNISVSSDMKPQDNSKLIEQISQNQQELSTIAGELETKIEHNSNILQENIEKLENNVEININRLENKVLENNHLLDITVKAATGLTEEVKKGQQNSAYHYEEFNQTRINLEIANQNIEQLKLDKKEIDQNIETLTENQESLSTTLQETRQNITQIDGKIVNLNNTKADSGIFIKVMQMLKSIQKNQEDIQKEQELAKQNMDDLAKRTDATEVRVSTVETEVRSVDFFIAQSARYGTALMLYEGTMQDDLDDENATLQDKYDVVLNNCREAFISYSNDVKSQNEINHQEFENLLPENLYEDIKHEVHSIRQKVGDIEDTYYNKTKKWFS